MGWLFPLAGRVDQLVGGVGDGDGAEAAGAGARVDHGLRVALALPLRRPVAAVRVQVRAVCGARKSSSVIILLCLKHID